MIKNIFSHRPSFIISFKSLFVRANIRILIKNVNFKQKLWIWTKNWLYIFYQTTNTIDLNNLKSRYKELVATLFLLEEAHYTRLLVVTNTQLSLLSCWNRINCLKKVLQIKKLYIFQIQISEQGYDEVNTIRLIHIFLPKLFLKAKSLQIS